MADLRSAAFRSHPFRVGVRGVELEFPPLPAARWLGAIPYGAHAVLHLSGSVDAVIDALQDGEMELEDVKRLINLAIGEAAGRPYWEAERLIGSVFNDTDRGRVLGEMTLAGVDPERITLAAFCSAVWSLLIRNADSTQRLTMEAELSIPPDDAEAEDFGPEEDFAAMTQRMRAMPGVSVG